jgi:hypothetical protein
MRARAGAESIESRGATSWNDWFDPIDGARLGDGSVAKTKNSGIGAGGTGGGGADALSKTTGLDALSTAVNTDILPGFSSECKDGVCPVPWAVKEETPVVVPDTVNHPPHYTDGGIECIEAIEAALTNEEFRGYCKANCMKYIWREKHKGGTESLKKAQWYLDRLIQLDEAQKG